MPELPTLSTVDISQTDHAWVCTKLDPETILSEGVHLAYEVTRVLRWLVE